MSKQSTLSRTLSAGLDGLDAYAVSVEVAGESHAAEMYMEMSGSYEHDVSTGE